MPRLLLCLCTVLLAQGCAVDGGTPEDTVEGSDCFYQSQIRTYQVIDEQYIAVNLTANRVYLVELWRPARNLDRTRRIAFKSPTNRVCSGFSEVLVDGGVRIRSIQEISEAERDVLLGEGETDADSESPVDGAEIEDVSGDEPAQEQEEDQQ